MLARAFSTRTIRRFIVPSIKPLSPQSSLSITASILTRPRSSLALNPHTPSFVTCSTSLQGLDLVSANLPPTVLNIRHLQLSHAGLRIGMEDEKTAKLSLNSHLATSFNISLTLNDEFTSVSLVYNTTDRLGHQANNLPLGGLSTCCVILKDGLQPTFWITLPFTGAFQRKTLGP
jgi:hypothetical protein